MVVSYAVCCLCPQWIKTAVFMHCAREEKKKRKSVFMLFIASVSKQDEQAY